MNPGPLITKPRTSLDQAWKSWRSVPDGNRYQVLTRQLGIFVQEIVREALVDGKALLTTTIPHVGRVFITVVESNGRRTITNHTHVTDFDEVVNDYLTWICRRYLQKSDTQHVQSPAYIRMGIVMRAYTLERKEKNKKQREVINDNPAGELIRKEKGSTHDRLKTLWFYPHGEAPIPDLLPPSFQGLSLRYIYVALRHNAGTSLSEIARELDIHASRVTAVKKEYTRLFPHIHSSAWMKIDIDYKPICVEESMMHKLNLKGCHHRYSLIITTDDRRAKHNILKCKQILWQAFTFAMDQAERREDITPEPFYLKILDFNHKSGVRLKLRQDHNHLFLMDYSPLTQKQGAVTA